MLRFKIYIIAMLSFISFIYLNGCRENKNIETTNEIKNVAKSMLGKVILFPDTLLQELTEQEKPILGINHKPKIISVISGNCESCVKNLNKWKPYLKELELKSYKYDLFFIVEDVDASFLKKYYGNEIPSELRLYFDKNQTFSKRNKLPHIKMLKTFMIDFNNEIVLIGNPIHDKNLWNLYLKRLSMGK